MNNYLSRTISLFILVGQCVFNVILFAPPAPAVDEKEMQQLESELAQFDTMIKNMSPEERKNFDAMMQEAVEEVRRGLTDEGKQLFEKLESGDISDDEIDKLLNELIPPSEVPAPAVEPKKEAEVVQPTPAPKPQPKPVITSKHQQAIDLIQTLIAHTNSFLVKGSTIVELPSDIQHWQKKKLISWKQGATWNTFKTELEKFVSLLNKLIERDKKSKEYLHIDELLKHESVYNSLSKLGKSVAQFEPKIEGVSPLTQKLNKTSEEALQKTISQYHEALYVLDLPENLKPIFEKFEPVAKKSRETHEAAEKKATEQSKQPRVPGAPVTGGRADDGYRGYTPSSADSYNGYSSNRYNDYSPSYQPYEPTFYPNDSTGGLAPATPAGSRAVGTGSGGKSAEARGDQSPEKTGPDRQAKVGETLAEQSSGKGAPMRGSQVRSDSETEKLFTKVEDSIETVAAALATNKSLADIKAFAMSPDIDMELVTKILPDEIRDELVHPRKGALGNIKALKIKLSSPQARAPYKTKLESLLRKHEKTFNSFISQIDDIQANWAELQKQVSLQKQYAYFEKPNIPPLDADQIQKLKRDIDAIEAEEMIGDPEVVRSHKAQKVLTLLSQVEQLKNLSPTQLSEYFETLNGHTPPIESQISSPVNLFELKNTLQEVIQAIKGF